MPCQFANGGPSIENSLLPCFHRVGKLTVMTLKVEPFQALKAGQKPRETLNNAVIVAY